MEHIFVMAKRGAAPGELLKMALVRARAWEPIANEAKLGDSAKYYTVGLLSALDVILQIDMTRALGVATVLAAEAARWPAGVDALEEVWGNFRVDQVFRTDTPVILRAGLHWAAALFSGGLLRPLLALLDNTPLRELLAARIHWPSLGRSLRGGALRALALCATGYDNGTSVAFLDGASDGEYYGDGA